MAHGAGRRPDRKNRAGASAEIQAGDILIDGGNSYFKDDVRRSQQLKDKGIHYVDVGTSGGVWGLDRGYCMMIGGPKEAVQLLDPIFKTLAPGAVTFPALRAAKKSPAPPKTATSTAAPPAPDTS